MITTQTDTRCLYRSAAKVTAIPNSSIDLVVTSPTLSHGCNVGRVLRHSGPARRRSTGQSVGKAAFEHMYSILDSVLNEVCRCIRPGGIVCVNIGDATRSLVGDFQLYPNHVRIVQALRHRGLALLSDILWHKPNNAPSKFIGSGMFTVGAYVTHEHEYILILRSGEKRQFRNPGTVPR